MSEGGVWERRKQYKNKCLVNALVVCVIGKKVTSFSAQAKTLFIHLDAWKTEV